MGKSEYAPYDQSKLTENTNEMVIPSGYFNANEISSLIITNNGNLKRIVIGGYTFGKVRVLNMDGLSELENVVIGQGSFTYVATNSDIWSSKRIDGSCRIVNCTKLKSIQLVDYSFGDYHSLELSNLPSLQSIDIGYMCLNGASNFSVTSKLRGLFEFTDHPQLQSFNLGTYAFQFVKSVVFESE